MTSLGRAVARRNFSACPENIFALCDGSIGINATENRAATTDSVVVYEHEPAEVGDALVIIDYERRACVDGKPPDFVALQLLIIVDCYFKRRGIHLLLDRHDLAFHCLCGKPNSVEPADSHRLPRDPKKIGMKPVRPDRSFRLMRGDVTTL